LLKSTFSIDGSNDHSEYLTKTRNIPFSQISCGKITHAFTAAISVDMFIQKGLAGRSLSGTESSSINFTKFEELWGNKASPASTKEEKEFYFKATY
jgi:hypothetical protein